MTENTYIRAKAVTMCCVCYVIIAFLPPLDKSYMVLANEIYLSELLVMFLGVCPPGLRNSLLWFSSLRLLLSASSSLMGTDALEDAIEGDWNLKSIGELVGVLRDD